MIQKKPQFLPLDETQRKWIVITTINPPTDAVKALLKLTEVGWDIVVVGDEKTPEEWARVAEVHFLSLDRQFALFPHLACMAPLGHYSRKNLGYLYAINQGADCILETDDDNWPLDSFGQNVSMIVDGNLVGGGDWVNIYRFFSDENIWPRGLPLDAIHHYGKIIKKKDQRECPIQQFLVDADPDVDAIFRMVFKDCRVEFNKDADPIILEKGTWVPFNSQNTLFFPFAFPVLYLPHFVSFRMTDIWRSFVAQAALWNHDRHLVFHTSTAKQFRNAHNLVQDFEQEIPGYLSNRKIAEELLAETDRLERQEQKSLSSIARRLWKRLIDKNIISQREHPLIDAWFASLESETAHYQKEYSGDQALYHNLG